MIETHLSDLKKRLDSTSRIVIVPHKNPDGDALGSSLALWHYLRDGGHDVKVIAPNDYPKFLKWMPGNNAVLIYEFDPVFCDELINEAELIFTLDFNDLSRTGEMAESLKKAECDKVLIDHHQQPLDYARFMYSDPDMCSTCQMMFHFFEKLDATDKITPAMANCLYAGIMTDTGSFRYPSTTSLTHRVIAQLIDKGARNSDIHMQIYDNQSFNRLQLLGCALQNLKVLPDLKTSYIVLSKQDLERYDFKKGDTEGVVNYGLSVEGVEFTVIFIEHQKENMVKISLRSKGSFDVNKFARAHFNGGGHVNAAGGRSELSLEETVQKFLTILPDYKNDLKS